MLDSTTKRRIDDCRDILVGKVPDPKSQIDQITVALIYKFMHDMDQEAVELGGKPTFFATHPYKVVVNGKEEERLLDYTKYAWPLLTDTKLGGEDRVKLYAEALERMPENPGLPQLFRDIFKNTYLPYRDPATLREFLKRINEFTYDHSEKLGDAFEYLLSIMGSQGEAGQFRTPRHLIDFMTAVIDPQKHETIMDPACGTAGFLISAYKHILRHNSSNLAADDPLAFQLHGVKQEDLTVSAKKYAGDKLSPDDRKRLVRNIVGYDIDPGMVKLALVNLYLHGFPEPHIFEYDTLTSTDRWEERFDVVLANPPFMSPKGGIKPHGKFGIPSTRSEVLFVDYIAEHLNPNGRALIVVPEGIIFQSGNAYKALRKKLVDEHYLVGVVSVPGGVFNPYSGVKTSLLWFDRALARKTDKLLFVKVEADGFDLGAQRRPIAQNDLPEVFALMMDYKRALVEGTAWEVAKGWEEKAVVVERNSIGKNGDFSLSADRYLTSTPVPSEVSLVALGDVCEINPESADPIELFGEKSFSYIDLTSVENGTGRIDLSNVVNPADAPSRARRVVREGDVLLATVRPNLKAFAYVSSLPERVLASTGFAVLRPKDGLNAKYLHQLLFTDVLVDRMVAMSGKGAYPSINQTDVASLEIPLPPLAEQEALVAEVEGYQKVIDGARQVVKHYKPRITIDPSWEMVELGEVCEVNPKKSQIKDKPQSIEVSFLPMADLPENVCPFTPPGSASLGEVYQGYTYFEEDDVLVAKVTPCFENGKISILRNLKNGIGFGSSEFHVLRCSSRILPAWAYVCVVDDAFRRSGAKVMVGTGGLKRIPTDYLRSARIPLPPLPEQERIAAALEEERRMVEGCRQLVERMEAKVRERVARVWGNA